MATLRIPVRRDIYKYTLEPDGLGVVFECRLDDREDMWVLDIQNVLLGIPILGGVDILEQFKYLEIPQGELRTFDMDGLSRDPTKELFGNRVVLIYIEP